MSAVTIVFIALALAMDAFAVSIASGLAIQKVRWRHALIMGGSFGLFQAVMPLIGWAGGLRLRTFIGGMDHWVAFILLGFVGTKMIYEGFTIESVEQRTNPWDWRILLLLSVATSLDALATGFGFALLKVAILRPILIIGGVTFLMSFVGCWIGEKGGHFFEKKIEVLGGVILIAIGIRLLLEHLQGA